MSKTSHLVARSLKAIAGCLTLGLATINAQAVTYASVGTVDLAARSEFIFHGKVIERWVAAGPREGSIYTYVRFSVSDVLKGESNQASLVLRFLGGTLDGRTLRVEGMVVPLVGEEGVFFVERLGRHQAYPFYGWDQGRFVVREDSTGQKSVFTHDGKPVGDVAALQARPGVGTGVAAGVSVAVNQAGALGLESFKARIRAIVEAQQ